MCLTATADGGWRATLWIRADGGAQMGFGHWVRVRRLGMRMSSWARVFYIVRDRQREQRFFDTGSEAPAVLDEQHALGILPSDRPDCLITDLPQVDTRTGEFIEACRSSGAVVVSIHDMGLGIYGSDMAIDPSVATLHPYPEEHYAHGVYRGPRYAVLPEAFAALREMRGNCPSRGRSLLVTLGGGSTREVMEPLLPGLGRLARRLAVTVLAGLVSGQQHWLSTHCPPGVTCRSLAASDDLGRLLLAADLAVVAGGVTLYEAACLGTPAIVVAHHELQEFTASRFVALGIAQYLGLAASISGEQLESAVLELAGDADRRSDMGRRGRELLDGRGAERVEQLISSMCVKDRN